MANNYTYIDLFCGAGGMSYGFEKAGFTPVLAIDNWQDALDTYKFNNPNGNPDNIDLTKAKMNILSISEHTFGCLSGASFRPTTSSQPLTVIRLGE